MSHSLADVKCFLLDMDGTFNLGNQIIDGSLEFISILRKQKKQYIFLTNNSSKNSQAYAEKITSLGLKISSDTVFTSGEATAIFLGQHFPNTGIYLIGTPALKTELENNGTKFKNKCPGVVVLGFDTTLNYRKLWKLCDYVRAGLPYIATHPDFNCPTETGYMPDIGAMIAFVKASTGREPDYVIGKPNRFIVDALAKKLNIQSEDLAMIGDRLYTDIALGHNAGITSCLVLTGETKLEDLEGSDFRPDYIFNDLREIGKWLVNNQKS